MDWRQQRVSLYERQTDTTGRPVTLDYVLKTAFGENIFTICELRKLDQNATDYKATAARLKANLQLFAPSALLSSRAKGLLGIESRTNVLQLDFDYQEIKNFDLSDLKAAVAALPFIGYCGLSCSGFGFYALAVIAEPEKLSLYAEHCFDVFKSYGINLDTTKGRNAQDLRYISYDCNALPKSDVEPLLIKGIRPKERLAAPPSAMIRGSKGGLLAFEVNKILSAQCGSRWQVVQQAAFALGGLCDENNLSAIEGAIRQNPEFSGEEEKYIKCARDCFRDGYLRPLIH